MKKTEGGYFIKTWEAWVLTGAYMVVALWILNGVKGLF